MLDYPRTTPTSREVPWATSKYPWVQGGRSHGKSRDGLYPVPTGSELSLAQCQGGYHGQIGLGFSWKGSSLGGLPHSLQPRPGTLRSLPVGNRAQGWKEEKACPWRRSCVSSFAFALVHGLLPLSVARPLEGWSATLGFQVPLEGVPRNPSGRLSILRLPDSRLRLLEHLCFCCSGGGCSGRGHRVTVGLSLCDGAGLGATV